MCHWGLLEVQQSDKHGPSLNSSITARYRQIIGKDCVPGQLSHLYSVILHTLGARAWLPKKTGQCEVTTEVQAVFLRSQVYMETDRGTHQLHSQKTS